jgi:hypothetical protein
MAEAPSNWVDYTLFRSTTGFSSIHVAGSYVRHLEEVRYPVYTFPEARVCVTQGWGQSGPAVYP